MKVHKHVWIWKWLQELSPPVGFSGHILHRIEGFSSNWRGKIAPDFFI